MFPRPAKSTAGDVRRMFTVYSWTVAQCAARACVWARPAKGAVLCVVVAPGLAHGLTVIDGEWLQQF